MDDGLVRYYERVNPAMTITVARPVSVREASYVDPRAGHNKFYRVFVAGNRWCSQYGRRGTAGTFTKIVEAAEEAAATKAADAKFISKVKKGYEPSLSGVVMVADMSDTGALDLAVQALPVGNNAVAGPVPSPVAADPPPPSAKVRSQSGRCGWLRSSTSPTRDSPA